MNQNAILTDKICMIIIDLKVKALTVTGTATERVENGIHIYDPGKQEWLVIKEFDDFEKAENWMADYIRKNHFYYGDFKITR